MRTLTFAIAAVALTACTHQDAADQAQLEQERLAAQSGAVFESVEEHAQCAGFHRAHAALASNDKNKAAFYTNAATNAEIAAKEIAASELQIDLATEMVNELAEAHAAEWAYTIKSKTDHEQVMSQEKTCQALALQQKSIVRDIVRAKYGFENP
ncbi:MAG: hypothetical protein ACR2RE_28550 [Geminicoccaceae bacterium]